MADFNWDDHPIVQPAPANAAFNWDEHPVVKPAESAPKEDWIDKLAGYLPAAGGIVGGIMGIPADIPTLGGSTIAGAGVGAAGGEALKNLIHEYRHPEQKDDTGALTDLIEGAKSAAGQAVGEKVIAPLIAPVLNAAIRSEER